MRGCVLALAVLGSTLPATRCIGTFQIASEFPATQRQPFTHNYVTLLANASQLPQGTAFLRLVIDDPGPGNASALPFEWAAAGTTARLMFAPNNFSTQGIWVSRPPSNVAPSKGSVKVHAEAWSDRIIPGDHSSRARKLGSSVSLDVFFDHAFASIRFDAPKVVTLGPGQALIEFPPHPADAARLAAAVQLFFFCRVAPNGNYSNGVPLFSNQADNQFQFGTNRFRVAWTSPGVYYIALNGAWNGNTMHTVMLSPLDGIETALFPQVAMPGSVDSLVFQPLALIVPWENGTVPQPPRGFRGASHVLPAIAGDRRVALTKRDLTWFHGAHFYMPLKTVSGVLPSDLVRAPTVALDVALPTGCELINGSDSRLVFLPAAGRSRQIVRLLPTTVGTGLSDMLSLGVLLKDETALVGTQHIVRFRAWTNESLVASSSTAGGWVAANVTFVARPSFQLPVHLSTGLSFGGQLVDWPSTQDGSVMALDTYRRLGFNTVPGSLVPTQVPEHARSLSFDGLTPAQRTGPEWQGLKYGPQGSAWSELQDALSATTAAVASANLSSVCPGLTPDQESAEREKWMRAAQFYADLKARGGDTGFDMAYDGCIRTQSVNQTVLQVAHSRPDVVIYDVEGYTYWELWQENIQLSTNAMSRRRAGETLSQLALRMAQDWLDQLIDASLRASPSTASALWDGEAQDNKGCCSGKRLGIFPWTLLQAKGCWSFPGLYNGIKNLELLAARLRREKQALPQGWPLLPTLTPMGAMAFAGGVQRSAYNFDVLIQAFANGATGLSVFEDPYVDDPGIHLAYGRAISIAAQHESTIINGSIAADLITVLPDSAPALGSAVINTASNEAFMAVTPRVTWTHEGPDPPAPVLVRFRFESSVCGDEVQLIDLESNAMTLCFGHCVIERNTSASMVFAARPI